MREIILDTESTGLDPLNGDRLVEIGCVEIFSYIPTGKTFQAYINPQRSMPSAALAVHGLTEEFLANKPVFAEIVGDFLDFIGEAPLVMHNAVFDMSFLNAELVRHGFAKLEDGRAVDTLPMARKMFPGAPASLDALCKRFGVDASGRDLHGALLDARLLAEVYLELRGGRQPDLVLASVGQSAAADFETRPREFRAPRTHRPTEEELAAHEAFLQDIPEALWKRA